MGMAVGDVFKGLSSVDADAYLDIQPSAGVEAVVHNVYHEDDIEIEVYDGANSLVFDIDGGMGVYARYAFHVTNTQRIRVKNTAGAVKLVGYDGVVTKE
jgi:hypothetical protein